MQPIANNEIRLKDYLSRYKSEITFGVIFSLFATVLSFIFPRILSHAIDTLKLFDSGMLKSLDSTRLLYFAGLIILVAVLEGVFRFGARMFIIRTSRKIEYDIRNQYFARLIQQDQAFFQRNRTGDLMARATNDLNAVRMMIGPGILYPVNSLIVFSVGLAFMLTINIKLTLLALSPLVVITIFVYKTAFLIQRTFKSIQEKFSEITTKTQENISGIRVIKGYVQEQNEIEDFESLNHDYIRKNILLAKIRGFLWNVVMMLSGIGMLIVFWIGGREVIRGEISLGDFTAFTVYLGLLTWPVISLGWVVTLFERGKTSLKRMNEIMAQQPDIFDKDDTPPEEQAIRGEIEFRDVSFSYPASPNPVLNYINLKIKQGQTIAIVGQTGVGKTTLVNLIPRLIDATSGKILIDGVDIQQIPLSTLRRNIGYVPQETFLFSDSIKNNISLGVDEPDQADITNAANISQVLTDIQDFPDGFETLLGERGINLSGGQKQRTAIARAIIRKPSILILDDALSSVDTYTEEKILKKFKNIMHERTSIIISHRISTISDADLIVVLDDGKIAEQGKHDELLKFNGIYAELYRKQLIQDSLANI
ncbi:ABC transporter ATP-binding protein [candidate division KSB1 bacterium]|nr:ABC transporter ATP-binding protein [candidate division KSB1 bacterium]